MGITGRGALLSRLFSGLKRESSFVRYAGRDYRTLRGHGFKANYFDVETGDHYWISGCRKDGADRL